MKHIFTLCLGVLLTLAVGAQQKKATWKEMDAFHTVMSETYHPSEEGNLKPLKANVQVLTSKVEAWRSAVVPQGYNAEVVKPILAKLASECWAIEKAVREKKNDAELKKMIAAAHDTFHELMEKCTH